MRGRIGGEMMNNSVLGITVIVTTREIDLAVSAVMNMVKRCRYIHSLAVVIIAEEEIAAIIRVAVVEVEAGRGPVGGAGLGAGKFYGSKHLRRIL